MGTECRYSLEIKTSPNSKKTIEKILKDLFEFDMRYYATIAFKLDGSTREELSWDPDAVIELFVPFSSNHMDVMFIVTGIYPAYDSHQKMYFYQGKHYVEEGVVVYPNFDKSKLK